ncbi:hypothetical protein [Streptomyces mesophilus]
MSHRGPLRSEVGKDTVGPRLFETVVVGGAQDAMRENCSGAVTK